MRLSYCKKTWYKNAKQICTKLFFNCYQKRQSGNWLQDQSSHFASYL